MAHYDHEKPGGVWGLFALLSSGIMSSIDKKLTKAINGDEGGTWTPQNPNLPGAACPIIIGGDGLQVPGPFVATDAAITITSGKYLTINSGAFLQANNGSHTYLNGVVDLHNTLTVSVSGTTGRINFGANTFLTMGSTSLLEVASGGVLTFDPGSHGYVTAGGVVEVQGSFGSPAGLLFTNFATARFATGSLLLIDANGSLRVNSLGGIFIDAGGTIQNAGSAVNSGTVNFTSTSAFTLHGTNTIKSDASLAIEAGASVQSAASITMFASTVLSILSAATVAIRTGATLLLETGSTMTDGSTRTRTGPEIISGDLAVTTPRFKLTPTTNNGHFDPSTADYWDIAIVGFNATFIMDLPARPCVFWLVRIDTVSSFTVDVKRADTMVSVASFPVTSNRSYCLKWDGTNFAILGFSAP
jgi:hypothetical protein